MYWLTEKTGLKRIASFLVVFSLLAGLSAAHFSMDPSHSEKTAEEIKNNHLDTLKLFDSNDDGSIARGEVVDAITELNEEGDNIDGIPEPEEFEIDVLQTASDGQKDINWEYEDSSNKCNYVFKGSLTNIPDGVSPRVSWGTDSSTLGRYNTYELTTQEECGSTVEIEVEDMNDDYKVLMTKTKTLPDSSSTVRTDFDLGSISSSEPSLEIEFLETPEELVVGEEATVRLKVYNNRDRTWRPNPSIFINGKLQKEISIEAMQAGNSRVKEITFVPSNISEEGRWNIELGDSELAVGNQVVPRGISSGNGVLGREFDSVQVNLKAPDSVDQSKFSFEEAHFNEASYDVGSGRKVHATLKNHAYVNIKVEPLGLIVGDQNTGISAAGRSNADISDLSILEKGKVLDVRARDESIIVANPNLSLEFYDSLGMSPTSEPTITENTVAKYEIRIPSTGQEFTKQVNLGERNFDNPFDYDPPVDYTVDNFEGYYKYRVPLEVNGLEDRTEETASEEEIVIRSSLAGSKKKVQYIINPESTDSKEIIGMPGNTVNIFYRDGLTHLASDQITLPEGEENEVKTTETVSLDVPPESEDGIVEECTYELNVTVQGSQAGTLTVNNNINFPGQGKGSSSSLSITESRRYGLASFSVKCNSERKVEMVFRDENRNEVSRKTVSVKGLEDENPKEEYIQADYTFEIESSNQESEGELGLELSESSISAGESLTISAVNVQGPRKIVIKTPSGEKLEERSIETSSEEMFEIPDGATPGKYKVLLKPVPQGVFDTAYDYANSIFVGNPKATFTVTAKEEPAWVEYCRSKNVYKGSDETTRKVNCIRESILPKFFSDSAEELPEDTQPAKSVCETFITEVFTGKYTYDAEKRGCREVR